MKKAILILAAVVAMTLAACTSEQESVTPSRNRVGYSAWRTQVSYTHCEPLPKTGMPEMVSGSWEMNPEGEPWYAVGSADNTADSNNNEVRNDGILQHTACEEAPLAICNYVIEADRYTVWCTARKDGGPEGFIIVFNYVDPQHYCRLNFGCGGNTQHALEQISGGSTRQAAVHPGSVETGRWYDVKLTVAGDSVQAWLDDELVFDDELKQINN